MKYIVKIQYPWTVWYEREIEVEAIHTDHAADLARDMERKTDGFWDAAYQVGDGEAGDSEVLQVSSVDK